MLPDIHINIEPFSHIVKQYHILLSINLPSTILILKKQHPNTTFDHATSLRITSVTPPPRPLANPASPPIRAISTTAKLDPSRHSNPQHQYASGQEPGTPALWLNKFPAECSRTRLTRCRPPWKRQGFTAYSLSLDCMESKTTPYGDSHVVVSASLR